MRVAMFTEAYGLYGAERWMAAVANGLSRRGMHVTVARPPMDDDQSTRLQPEVTTRPLDLYTLDDPYGWMTNRTAAASVLDVQRPDVAIVTCGAVVACIGVREELLARRIPYLFVAHLGGQAGFDLPCPEPLRDRVATVLNGAVECIGVSHDIVSSLRADFGLAPDRGVAILNGRPDHFFDPVDPDKRDAVRRQLGIGDEHVMALTVARVHPNKGYQYQLDALDVLREQPVWDRLRFVWVGGEAENRLRMLVAARRLGGNVQLPGYRDDIHDLLGAADIFVLPSRQEGAPLTIVEAMARRLTIVTTPVNGIPDLVGDCAVIVADPNIDATATARELAVAIAALAEDPRRRAELGSAAYERASRLWREDRMIDLYQRLLEDCRA